MTAFDSLFGWAFVREAAKPEQPSFTAATHDDGALEVTTMGGSFGTVLDLTGAVKTESELISRYRDMAFHPEIDHAIDEIVNEAISTEEDDIVRLKLDKLDKKLPPKVLEAIHQCFEEVLNVLDFQGKGYDIFRRWYTDGRLYFHVILNDQSPENGIVELRYIDPRKIRKVREITKKKPRGGDITSGDSVISQTRNEYFVYSDKGFHVGARAIGPTTSGLKIAKDAIVYVTSGVTDTPGTMVLGHLHKAIKSLNQLRTLEDAVVIYRLVRAPERRLWYIDVGNLPKMKAEQYVRDIMTKHKNKVNYDAGTGQMRDDRKFMTMLEDYWLPRREGGRGTEVTTLPAGENLGEMDDVLYFQKKLYGSLHIPVSRLDTSSPYNIGVATEISNEEVKFGKFITRMRNRFSQLFIRLLEKQVVLKGIMTVEDFQKIIPYLDFKFSRTNSFTEQKNTFLMNGRLNLLNMVMPFVGRYYSNTWVRKNILMQDDEDIMQNDQEIIEEMQNPIYNPVSQAPPGEEGEEEEQSPATSATVVDPSAQPPGDDSGQSKKKVT